ncbi:chemotaxis protein CheD [Geoalkalibacter sp.]|uniref:chemotaxis protein CheD n=1 Tax=Geoalkalibacter sp. TaxID=3041440 RepID=UPI00272E840F|nr:chemotaxis protein CheD [Geoalkalibacter sp.]
MPDSLPTPLISILPGEYRASADAIVLSTLLGSCVAACLYDPVKRIIGMNHFLLCGTRSLSTLPLLLSESGRYGVHAMELLINDMLKLGAQRRHLRAKVFGGATIIAPKSTGPGVGELNCRFVREFLLNEKIPLMAEDLGGIHGRVIYFAQKDFSVLVRRIRKTSEPEIARRERQLLASLEKRKRREAGTDELWE